MRELGVTPLTWAFVKLLGRQLHDNVRDWDGLPNSHAWVQQLLTKAQCVGVLVSIHQRAERVELLVDDGTALVRAVQWTPSWNEDIALGDLVRLHGKLNMDSSWTSDTKPSETHPTRELRVVRIQKISDPNEELLHWLDVEELTSSVYPSGASASSGGDPPLVSPLPRLTRVAPSPWDHIVIQAFHELKISDEHTKSFLSRSDKSAHDQVLIEVLYRLIVCQRKLAATHARSTTQGPTSGKALRFTFPDVLRDILTKKGVAAADALHHATTRSLRYAFATLRSSGLIFLEDTDLDQYLLLSAEFVLEPALIDFFQKKTDGTSLPDVTEYVLTQELFSRVSIDSVERSLNALRQSGLLEYKGESQEFFLNRRQAVTSG